jgi:hypothetical protein
MGGSCEGSMHIARQSYWDGKLGLVGDVGQGIPVVSIRQRTSHSRSGHGFRIGGWRVYGPHFLLYCRLISLVQIDLGVESIVGEEW